jgi:hypothetical protein
MNFRSAFFLSLAGLASATSFIRQSFQTLTDQQISSYSPYTYYASAVKCGTDRVKPWNCGGAPLVPSSFPQRGKVKCRYVGSDASVPYAVNCQANPDFEIFDAGGNGDTVQFCMNAHRAVDVTLSVVCMLTPSIGFVGYDPVLDTVIVAHQATNTSQLYVNQEALFSRSWSSRR